MDYIWVIRCVISYQMCYKMCYKAPLGFLGRTCRRVGFTVSFTVSGILQLLLLKTSSVFCGFDQIQLGDDAPAKFGAGAGGKQGTSKAKDGYSTPRLVGQSDHLLQVGICSTELNNELKGTIFFDRVSSRLAMIEVGKVVLPDHGLYNHG